MICGRRAGAGPFAGFALAAVLCLTIGIVSPRPTTATFSRWFSAFCQLVRAPEELVRFQSRMPFGNWVEIHDRSNQFRSLAAFMGLCIRALWG